MIIIIFRCRRGHCTADNYFCDVVYRYEFHRIKILCVFAYLLYCYCRNRYYVYYTVLYVYTYTYYIKYMCTRFLGEIATTVYYYYILVCFLPATPQYDGFILLIRVLRHDKCVSDDERHFFLENKLKIAQIGCNRWNT